MGLLNLRCVLQRLDLLLQILKNTVVQYLTTAETARKE